MCLRRQSSLERQSRHEYGQLQETKFGRLEARDTNGVVIKDNNIFFFALVINDLALGEFDFEFSLSKGNTQAIFDLQNEKKRDI